MLSTRQKSMSVVMRLPRGPVRFLGGGSRRLLLLVSSEQKGHHVAERDNTPHVRSYSASSESGWQELQSTLTSCTGGSVDLVKCQETGIAVVTSNNPTSRNAYSGKMLLELADVVTELESWKEGKGLVFHGADGYFCSGGDLKTVRKIVESVKGVHFSSFVQDTLNRLRKLPLISVSVIQGKAMGAGAELAMCTDFRIMAKSSALGFIHLKMNISPGFGGGTMLTNVVGRVKALDILTSARFVEPPEALEIGLANAVFSDVDDPVVFGKKWLATFTSGSVACTRGAKFVVLAASELQVQESLENEAKVFGSLWGLKDHRNMLEHGMKC